MDNFSKKPTPGEFIQGAVEDELSHANDLPWENLNPRVQKAFTLRTDEQTLGKINWVVDRELGMRSVQQWLRKIIEEALERDIARILTESK